MAVFDMKRGIPGTITVSSPPLYEVERGAGGEVTRVDLQTECELVRYNLADESCFRIQRIPSAAGTRSALARASARWQAAAI